MGRKETVRTPSSGVSRETLGKLLQKLRIALIVTTVLPLLTFSVILSHHYIREMHEVGVLIAIIASMLVLTVAGAWMHFRLIASVAAAAQQTDTKDPTSRHVGGPRFGPGRGSSSVRRTLVEAAALIGVIPLLAMGYIVVKYTWQVNTNESLTLIVCIAASMIVLGVLKINDITFRIIAVAAAAKNICPRFFSAVPENGRDEIDTLSTDLSRISESFSTQLSELNRTRRLVECLPHPIFVIDTGGTITFANKAAADLLLCNTSDLLGMEASALFTHGEDWEWILGRKGRTPRIRDWRRKDGTDMTVSVCIGALPEDSGAGSVLIASDISEQARAQEELVIFRELINRSSESLSIIDMETGRFVYVNDQTCASTGYEREKLLTMRVADIDPSAAKIWDPEGERARRVGNPVFEREGLTRRSDGTTFPVEIYSSIVRFPKAEYMIAISRDITKRRQAEAEAFSLRTQLAHISRIASLGVFVGSLAHEINQPLAAILNNAQAGRQFIENGPPNMEEIRGALEDIIADTIRASNVISRMRSMLKKGAHAWQRVDINRAIEEIVELIFRGVWERRISIVCDLAPGLPPIRGDVIGFQQVVLNLLLNAFDAMKHPSDKYCTIYIRTATEGTEQVRISVRDCGNGISVEHLPVIFEPFFTTKQNGLGIGLSICKMIIEAHGGRLWAENNPDRGATFHLSLPAVLERQT